MSPTPSTGNRTSTVLGRRLGGELLRLRDAAGMTQQQAATKLSATATKVVKMERGWVPMRDPDIRALCAAYGVTDAGIVDQLCELARLDRERRKVKGWWTRATWSAPLREYIAIEQVATRIRSLQMSVVPGLFQTPDYIRALFLGGTDRVPAELEEAVDVRIKRQERLYGDSPLVFHAVVWEAALHQVIGSPETMAHQLARLQEVSDLPNVRLQILPFGSGATGCPATAFTILSFAPTGSMDVVHADGLSTSFIAENQEDSTAYNDYFQRTSGAALDPASSRELLNEIRKDMMSRA
ncbi:helix-turn-helix transcriptional regulator [Streptomyces sp. RFCAC02]|uniref:helix-turn-helix domain-containing protein n=1 Tax=Streptomyces sp. RFCAC02 TaxID=2499143 RepID=UPI001F0E55AC|nr:helix-turn-helix transcriptional regulator [Streptomyces sp. RFCAC02]